MPNGSIRFTPNLPDAGAEPRPMETYPFPHVPVTQDVGRSVLDRFSLEDYKLRYGDHRAAGIYDHTLPRNLATLASRPPQPGTFLLTVIAQKIPERNLDEDEGIRGENGIGQGLLADTKQTLAEHDVRGVERVAVHVVAGKGYWFEEQLATEEADAINLHPEGIPRGLPTPAREDQVDIICSWGSRYAGVQHSADITPAFVREANGLRIVNRAVRETVHDAVREVGGPRLFVNVQHLFNERGVDKPNVQTTDRFARHDVNLNGPTLAMSARAHPSIPGDLVGQGIATGLAVNVTSTLKRLTRGADPPADAYAAYEGDGVINETEYWGSTQQPQGDRYQP